MYICTMAKTKASIHELFLVEIMRTSEIIQHRINSLLKEYEITNPQYNILRILRGSKEDLCVGEVKERMLFETSDVSRLLDRLVKKGLVNRTICPGNRRKMDVSISKIGLQVLEKLDGELSHHLNDFYKDFLSEEEAERIIGTFQRIVEAESPVLNNIHK
jgi:DNA-binding MarR family transcriptional regulator